MSLYGTRVEYALHCILYLIDPPRNVCPSSRDVATFRGISPSYVAKLFTQMDKAGLVRSIEGVRGGYRLARPAHAITVLDVVDAVEPGNSLFHCRNIRHNCALFSETTPDWATRGTCSIHAVMLRAEKHMREQLAITTITDIAQMASKKIPPTFYRSAQDWFQERTDNRSSSPRKGKNNADT